LHFGTRSDDRIAVSDLIPWPFSIPATVLGMDAGPHSLIALFERYLHAQPRREHHRLVPRGDPPGQPFLEAAGKTLEEATRGDLEAFLADLLTRRAASTALIDGGPPHR
jgi:hypothetical protein